jgi:hypothetical protein
MADTTDNYGFLKPLVGGSENEWGGNLNDNFNELDKLLGGDSPVNGINIESGSIDGSLITGEIGQSDDKLEDDEEPLKVHPHTHISGKVDVLTGLNQDASDDNDKGQGIIRDCIIEARDLEVAGYIREGCVTMPFNTEMTLNPDKGTIHHIQSQTDSSTVKLDFSSADPGEELTVIFEKLDDTVQNVTWETTKGMQIRWIGGGSPDIENGLNVIQFFTIKTPSAIVCIGAASGVAP